MAKTCVKIDRERLARRLSADGAPLSPGSVHLWLVEQGFTHRGDVWYCDGDRLRRLQPGEIMEVVKSEQVDGVTFIEHEVPEAPRNTLGTQ